MNLHNKVKSLKDGEVDILLQKVWPEIYMVTKGLYSTISLSKLRLAIECLRGGLLSDLYLDKINSHLFKKRSLLIENYTRYSTLENMNPSKAILVYLINRKSNGIKAKSSKQI